MSGDTDGVGIGTDEPETEGDELAGPEPPGARGFGKTGIPSRGSIGEGGEGLARNSDI